MSRSSLHFVTGATGLVGSAIILELLQVDPRARVIALVRAAKSDAVTRLRSTLQRAARLHGLEDQLDQAIHERCGAVTGDVHEPRCGVVELRPEWRGAALWHCAASLQFHDRYEQEVMHTNVDGTRHVLELARALEVQAFEMVSTAYVVGMRTGSISEAPIEPSAPHQTNNAYERSKVLAEALVRDSGLRARILRPSIVIGHSRTRAALTFSGLYGFTRGVFKFRRLMERTQAHLMDSLEVRLIADPEGELDLIPVDFVARDAVALSRADAEPGVYHLAAVARMPCRRAIEVVFEVVGLRPPRFVSDRAELTWIDRKLDDAISVYNAYLLGSKRFERTHTDRWLECPAGKGYVLDDHELRRFCELYVRTELANRASLPETA